MVDIGHAYVMAAQLQAGLDASALAGAARLADGPVAVRAAAIEVAAQNAAGSGPILISDSDVLIGTWDATTGAFVAHASADEVDGDAVQVGAPPVGVRASLSWVIGVRNIPVACASVAGATIKTGISCGIMADHLARLEGTFTADSYDSRIGAYDPADFNANAGVCSNDDITGAGNVLINGGLRDGPDPGDGATVHGSVVITGDTKALPDHVVMPDTSSTYAKSHNSNSTIGNTSSGKSPMDGSKFKMDGKDKLTLSAGTYSFTSFTLDGQAQLTVSGAVNIYVAGDFHANGGGIVNTSQNPADLTVLIDGTHSFQVNGNADLYGAILAPRCEGHINGNANFYGIVVGNDPELNGLGDFHVDEALVETIIGRLPDNHRLVLLQ